jgi:hypothetical protein
MIKQKLSFILVAFIVAMALLVVPVAADFSSISPSSGPVAGGTAVTITGANFSTTCSVTIGGTVATGLSCSSTQITATTPAGTAGARDVVITNTSDGWTTTGTGAFTYVAPLTISSITPSNGYNTSPVSITSLAGTGFSTTTVPVVVLRKSGSSNITATGVSATATSIAGTFEVTGIPAGTWDVIVTNPDGQSATLANGFEIKSTTAAVTISGITPANGVTNNTISITELAGTGFTGTPQVYLKRSNYNNIYGTFSTTSSTKLTGSFNINNRAPGSYEVCVINNAMDPVCGLSFTILATASAANGTIYFSSTPSGAVVYVDSVQKGNTPFTLYNVTPGSYAVKMQRASYLDWADRVTVTAGNQTTVTAQMTPVDTSTTVPTTAPVTITTATLPTKTVKSTVKAPTPWPSATPAQGSPVDIAVIVGAVAVGCIVLTRK